MKAASWIILIFGILVFVGGLMGHLKAKSTVSLVAGVTFGVLLVLSALGMFRDHLFPAYCALIMTLLLDAFFTYRWLLTFNFMPSGLMAILSTAVLIATILLLKNHLRPGSSS